jgi:hypothetical protein
MLSCPRCGGINTESGVFCQHCGERFGPGAQTAVTSSARPVKTCPSCGATNPVETNFCHDCGTPLGLPQAPEEEVSLATGDVAIQPMPTGGAMDTLQVPMVPGATARLINVRRDGTDGTSHAIFSEQYDLGRTEGDLLFDDPHMAGRHARLVHRDGQFVILPLETRNGVYVRLRQPVELYDGDLFLLGKQVLRFEVPFEVEKTVRPAVEHGVVLLGLR